MFHTKEIKMLIDKVGENALAIEGFKGSAEETGDLWARFKDITTRVNKLTNLVKDFDKKYEEVFTLERNIEKIKAEIITEAIKDLKIVVKVKD